MSDMPMMFSAMTALMAAAMMVAMMTPSLAVALLGYHRGLRTMRVPRAGERTVLFAISYAATWAIVGLVLSAIDAGTSSLRSEALRHPTFLSLATGGIVVGAGALQRSRWKAGQLARCRQACVPLRRSTKVMIAWRDGCRLGVECARSCAALMALLMLAGLMNAPMMAVITAAITAERVAPAGARIARLTGALALVAGAIMCASAIA